MPTPSANGTPSPEVRRAYQTIRSEKPWTHSSSKITHHRVLPLATLAPWLDDTVFLDLYAKVAEHTLVDLYRCYELWSLARQSVSVDGDILEVGVWRGGTGVILAEAVRSAPAKRVFLADTFTGVVKAGERDTDYKGGEHKDTAETVVTHLVGSLGLQNVKVLKGIFPDDTHTQVDGPIAMLHCDVDVYESARDVVEWCLPRLSTGAVLVFDDYGFYGCEGVTTFCTELRARKDFRFIHNLNGHAIFVKIA